MKKYIAVLIALLASTACSQFLKTDEKINAKVVNETVDKWKIKRVLEDDIVSTAYVMGQEAVDTALTIMPEGNAQARCRMFDFTKKLPEDTQKWVSRAVIRCEPNFFHHPKEKEIWEAYAQAMKDGIEVQGNVQRLGNKESYKQLVYTTPIKYQSGEESKWAMLSIVLDKSAVIMRYNADE